ncbi:hypothetical protein [Persicitalea sp.]|uniref:hypothetical protein n=1 Tax=Persicitalea sp. TaxID=3100273 RepID=UPI0035935E56
MKPYSEYTAEELAMERLFIRWVRYPDDSKVADYWVGWVRDNPEQRETVESAKALVDTVSDWDDTEISDEESVSLWKRIQKSIGSFPLLTDSEKSDRVSKENRIFLKWIMGIGATVVVIFFLFIRETTPYDENQESRNALAAPFDLGSHSKTDSIQGYSQSDSTKNKLPIK